MARTWPLKLLNTVLACCSTVKAFSASYLRHWLTFVDVGSNGRISDRRVLRDSWLQAALDNNSLGTPPVTCRPERYPPVPYVIVADEAFPLKENLLKPYSTKSLDDASRFFNYRPSRLAESVRMLLELWSRDFDSFILKLINY